MNIVDFLLLFLTAIGALLAALFTWLSANATKEAGRGAVVLNCLERYTAIMKDKRDARTQKNIQLTEEFYRELFDLHWSEFHLWRESIIPDDMMLNWVYAEKRRYDTDKIECTAGNGTTVLITHKDQWATLLNNDYFEMTASFVKFMNQIHSGNFVDIKVLRRAKNNFGNPRR